MWEWAMAHPYLFSILVIFVAGCATQYRLFEVYIEEEKK